MTVALNNRAGIRHDRGDLRGALEDYSRAIEIDPRLALLYGNRGVTRKALGDLKGAIADYTEAIRLRPDFNLAYFNRSAAWRAMGKGYEAEQDFIRSRGPGKEPEASLEPPIEGVPAAKPARP
ncbi:MAG: tetratricopeptide repeat protein [Blastocatellia bacterium]